MNRLPGQYRPLFSLLRNVWDVYGGARALRGSPTLHFSLAFALLSIGAWRDKDWWMQGLSIIPGILGFAIATFAIFLAIGDDRFREILGKGGEPIQHAISKIYNSFVFLILVQLVAVLYCMLASSRPLTAVLELAGLSASALPSEIHSILKVLSLVFRYTGYALVVYALLSVLPMTMSVLRMGKLYISFLGTAQKKK